jgi:hypothetical protein
MGTPGRNDGYRQQEYDIEWFAQSQERRQVTKEYAKA